MAVRQYGTNLFKGFLWHMAFGGFVVPAQFICIISFIYHNHPAVAGYFQTIFVDQAVDRNQRFSSGIGNGFIRLVFPKCLDQLFGAGVVPVIALFFKKATAISSLQSSAINGTAAVAHCSHL